jgi:hypothetical protein
MRKKVRRRLADLSTLKRAAGEAEFRQFRREEKDLAVVSRFNSARGRRPDLCKSTVEQERTYKLLCRGIPSHFYKNLNKSQS